MIKGKCTVAENKFFFGICLNIVYISHWKNDIVLQRIYKKYENEFLPYYKFVDEPFLDKDQAIKVR